MKFLLFSPDLDFLLKARTELNSRGIAALVASDPEIAFQVLQMHGSTIDLLVIHREGLENKGTPGLELIGRVKLKPELAEIPFIVSSSAWNDIDFYQHQQGPMGANAYLKAPWTAEELAQLSQKVLGNQTPETPFTDAPKAAGTEISAPSQESMLSLNLESLPSMPGSTPEAGTPGSLELEDASKIFTNPSISHVVEEMKIQLEVGEPSQPEMPKVEALETSLPGIVLPDLPSSPVVPQFSQAPEENTPVPSEPSQSSISSESKKVFHDKEAEAEMPYLFQDRRILSQEMGGRRGNDKLQALLHASGDSIIPGGAAHAPDIETLKKYLLLREQDVMSLSAQLKSSQERIRELEEGFVVEKARSAELKSLCEIQEQTIDQFNKRKENEFESMRKEVDQVKFDAKIKTDKAKMLESQLHEAIQETEKIKERVRNDIRKIRVREKDLEHRLEILRKDSEALLSARENKIVDLKRKTDLLEFNLDLMQDRFEKEKELVKQLKERLAKAAQVVRVVGGVLDEGTVQSMDDLLGPQEESA